VSHRTYIYMYIY